MRRKARSPGSFSTLDAAPRKELNTRRRLQMRGRRHGSGPGARMGRNVTSCGGMIGPPAFPDTHRLAPDLERRRRARASSVDCLGGWASSVVRPTLGKRHDRGARNPAIRRQLRGRQRGKVGPGILAALCRRGLIGTCLSSGAHIFLADAVKTDAFRQQHEPFASLHGNGCSHNVLPAVQT